MTKIATPKAIADYREKLLTNPATFGQRLQQVREDLRSRSEVLFIDRDLTASDKSIDDETRKAEFERLDEMILRIGARIDDLDEQIAAHKKAHPDAEIAAMIRPQGVPEHLRQRPAPTPVKLTRQQRRAISKAEARRLTAQGAPLPAEIIPGSAAEETPEAEG